LFHAALRLFEIARMLVRLDQLARIIVNAMTAIMFAAAKLRASRLRHRIDSRSTRNYCGEAILKATPTSPGKTRSMNVKTRRTSVDEL
jgi:hypothetical protein